MMSDVIHRVLVQMWTGGSWYVETFLRGNEAKTFTQFFHPDQNEKSPQERAEAYAARIVRDCN